MSGLFTFDSVPVQSVQGPLKERKFVPATLISVQVVMGLWLTDSQLKNQRNSPWSQVHYYRWLLLSHFQELNTIFVDSSKEFEKEEQQTKHFRDISLLKGEVHTLHRVTAVSQTIVLLTSLYWLKVVITLSTHSITHFWELELTYWQNMNGIQELLKVSYYSSASLMRYAVI